MDVARHSETERGRRFEPATEQRIYRLSRGITLMQAAMEGGFSLARASTIERFPRKARPGELERLKAAVDTVAASRQVA